MDKLYKALYDQGKYTKSAEDFKTQFGSQEGQKKLYSALNKTGAYTRSFDDFNKQFFTAPIESVKTNDSAAADPSVESNATGSNWADGSSGQLNSGFISENNRGKREKRLKESEYDGTMISRMFDDDPNNSFADNVSESFKDFWKGLEKNNPVFMASQMAAGGPINQVGALAAGISKWVQKDDAEDQAAIANNPELFEKYNGYRNDVSLDKQAEQLYNNKDLNISDTDSNLAYNTDKATDFVNEYYINNPESKKLLEEANVSASDFQGFLNRKGYTEDFISQKEAGAYQQDDSGLPDNLTMQQDLKMYFDEYLIETAGRNIERVVLEEIKNNPSEYKGMSLPEAMEAADVKLMEDPEKYNYGTHLDFNKLEGWNSNNWDSINKYRAEQIENIEAAQQTRIEETETGVKTGLYGTGRTLLSALGGLGDGLEDAYDFFKADGKMLGFVYSKGRQANEFRDLRDKSNRRSLRGDSNINYLYAEGKQVTINGKEYIKQANGSIKQITNGFDVSKTISDKDRKAIDDAIERGDYKYGSDFDGFGGSIIAGQTIGELAIQIVGQKGTGLLRRAASLKYLGKVKNLSKARLDRMEAGINSSRNMRGVNYGGVTGGAKGTWDTFGKKIPLGISKGMADAIIFQSGYGAMTGYNQAKTAALDAGMGMEESEAIANEASLGMAALFALTTPINPKTGLIDKIFKGTGKNSTASLFRQLINASGNAAGIRKNFAKIVAAPLQTKLAKFGAVVASEGAKEMVQENVQQVGEAALNKVLNKGIGKDLLKDTYSYEDFVNTSALSFAAGGFAGGVGSISTLTGRKNIMNDSEKVQKLRQLMQNPAKVEKIFDSWVKNGDITRKEADGLNQEIQKFSRNINKMPKFLSDRRMSTELLKVIDSQENISKLEKQRKNAIPGEQALIDEKLKVLKEQQTKLLVDAQATLDADNEVFEGKFTKNTAAVVNFARKLGFGESKLPRIFENTDAYVTAIYRALKRKERSYLKAVKEGKIKADPDFKPLTKAEVAKQAAESDGVYLGAGSLFINKEMARQTGKWTVTSHEIIHPILNSLVGSYLNQKANYDDLMKILPAKVRRSINKKIEQTQGKEKQATEFLNYLSDAVISGELDFDPSLFDKIRLWFNNIISKLGLKSGIENHEDLHFDDARGVYNWLKEFTSGLKEGGEISDKAVEAVQKAETKADKLVSEDPGLRDPENAMQFSSSQEILNLENALDDALDAFAGDPNNPNLEQKVEEAERLLEEAEERVASGRSAIKQEAKPKPKPKKKVEAKPVRTTDLGPRDPISKKIMNTYNEGMEGVSRPEYKASKPLPSRLEGKLVPMFEGYINTIVQQKFKQFDTEALEFQDALSILRTEVSSAIRTYNPAKNKDLAGYTKKIVQTRQSLMFKDANKEFASALDDAKGIVATNDEVSVDRSGAVERGQSTFDQLDIVDDNLIKEISTELEKEIRIRTQKGTLSESRKVTQKVKGKSYETLVPWIEDYVEKTLFKKLSKKLGAIGQTKDPTTGEQKTRIPGPYIDFLNDKNTFDIITKALPIKTLKSNYSKLFKVTKIGREKTAEGNPIFRVEPTKPKAFLQYFLDAKFGTLLARQKQLFREILRPVAKEVIADYATPENISELKSIQELAPETSIDITSDIALEAQLNNLESILDRYKGEEKSFDIIQFSSSLKNTFGLEKDKVDFTNYEQVKSARSGLIKLFRSFKKEGFSAETVANMFVGTSRGSYGLLAKKYITIEKGNLLKILNLKTKKWRSNRFLLTGTADLFELLKKVYKNVDYTKGASDFKQDGKTIELDKIPSQGTKGFVDGSMFYGKSVSKSSILDRKAYSQKQKSNLKNIIERLTEVHNNKYLTSNQVAMILGTLASSTNGLVRTAATLQGYSKQLLKNAEIIDDNFRFEHSQAAAFTVSQLAKLITDKNYPYTFDQIMDGFNVFIIPKVYDVIIGKVPGFYSGGPVDSKGYMVLSTAKYVARYQDPKVLKAIADAGLPPLVLTQFSKSEGSSINIYHGGDIKKIDDINGVVYFSEDKAQAAEYAKGNEGEVAEFKIKESDIVSEDVIYNEIDELGLKARNGFEVDELNLYELIDPAFETSLSKSDLAKLFKSLNKKGIKAVRFTDMNLKSLKNDISNIAVFDKKSIIDQTEALQFSKNLDKEFNDIIEESTGIESGKTIYEAASKNIGRTKGRFKFFIPPSAEDFVGLMYKLLSKGKKGEKQQAWLKEALFDPYAEAMRDFESYKQNAAGIVKQLTKSLKKIPSSLTKNNSTGFTNEQAIRVFIWSKKGYDIPGLSKQEAKDLIAVVKNDPKLLSFADEIESSLNGYPEPSNSWYSGTITTDAVNMINTTKRAEFLKEWQANSDIIFSKDNINKLRSEFGINYSEALEDMLYRMKTGRNRPTGDNKLTNIFMNWINDSVGTIMFFNSRSALLQTLSIVNFVNWSDNNPVKAAKAFSNQKQFWKDFSMLFNSDFLKQRRSGLKNDINADDIARSAETSRNKARAVLSTILKAGFLPTQIADSFAIAMGGASFIRNRTDSYISEGMSKKEAETKAFLDFQEIAEETQQSSRPDRVSQQQASPLGRIILAFANTPMQYMRLTKKAFLDLKNNRGDWKTNVSKIVYYTAIQNVIFSSLQAAMFASLFEDDDEEAIKDKQLRTANSMLDSVLRGVGVYGAIGSTLKNIYLEVNKQSNKDRPDYTQAALKALTISPPVDSKMRKIISASRAFSYKTTRDKMKGFGLDNPAYYAGGQVVSAAVNVPVDRVIRKIENVRSAFSNETEYWQKAALIFGYSKWDLGLIKDESKSGTWRSRTSKNKTYKTSKWKKRQ